jgi:hypothetical protein
MVDVRRNPYDNHIVVRKSGAGKAIAVIALAVVAIVAILFATGFWTADVREGSLPEVSIKGGSLPKVDVDSKEVVVGTKRTEVDVPTVGVKDDGKK